MKKQQAKENSKGGTKRNLITEKNEEPEKTRKKLNTRFQNADSPLNYVKHQQEQEQSVAFIDNIVPKDLFKHEQKGKEQV